MKHTPPADWRTRKYANALFARICNFTSTGCCAHPRESFPQTSVESACLRMSFADGIKWLTDSWILASACEQTISARIVQDKEQEMLLSLRQSSAVPVTRLHSKRGRDTWGYPCTRSAFTERVVTVGESHFREDTTSSELWAPTRNDRESRNFIT